MRGWRALHDDVGADAVDLRLHDERFDSSSRARRLHDVAFDGLPDGAFVLHLGVAKLVLGDELLTWSPAGYRERAPRPPGRATLVTPPSIVAVLRSGWQTAVPFLHPTA